MIILFDGELNEELGNTVVEQLLDIYTKNQAIIEANDRLKYKSDYLPLYCDTVEFRINSNGGDLFKFIQIWDLIDRLKEEQNVVFKGRVSSHAYSAGFYLLMLMDYRTVNKCASLMYHEMMLYRQEKLSNLDLESKRMAKIQAQLDKLVTDNTKLTQEMLDSYKGKDFWMDYEDCVKYGIVKEEPTEEELRQQLLGEEKDVMTESEFNEFIEEMKKFVEIVPDEEVDGDEDKEETCEGNCEECNCKHEEKEMYCIEHATCKKHEGTNKCCLYCDEYDNCDLCCTFAKEDEELICEYLTDKEK